MIISRTPFRISFFGGGSDYPEWYRSHGGQVLATSINKFCYITCRYLPPFFEHRSRVVYSKIETCHSLDEIEHPAVREVLKYLNIERGVEIHHDGDLPARSGMGSSSSFTVGLLHALYALGGSMRSKAQLAEEAIHIEQELLCETVGSQDQISTTYGGFNQISFSKDGTFSVRPMSLSRERIDELNGSLMLFYTGVERIASQIAGTYVPDIGRKDRQLRAITDMVDEGVTILNAKQDINVFGELLNRAWQVKSEISSVVSSPYIDEIYNRARSAGAVGGKLLGAGGGGFMLLFVPPNQQEIVKRKLSALIHVPFEFESFGSQIIFHDSEEDYSMEDGVRNSRSAVGFEKLPFNRTPEGSV